MRRLWFATLALLLIAAPAAARDIFVSNTGGDDLSDGSAPRSTGARLGPVQSIAKALRIAWPSDRIIIANTGQSYHESLSLQGYQHSGSSFAPFSIEGNGAILDGTAPTPAEAWTHTRGDIYSFAPAHATYQQLFLGDAPATMRPRIADEAGLDQLKPLEWTLHESRVYFRAAPGKTPAAYPLAYAALPVGITMYKVHDVVIHDLVVQGFQRDGINLHDADGPCLLQGVTCRGNGRAGIAAVGAARVDIRSSIVGDNGNAQLLLDGLVQVRVVRSELVDNTAPKWRFLNGRLLVDGEEQSR